MIEDELVGVTHVPASCVMNCTPIHFYCHVSTPSVRSVWLSLRRSKEYLVPPLPVPHVIKLPRYLAMASVHSPRISGWPIMWRRRDAGRSCLVRKTYHVSVASLSKPTVQLCYVASAASFSVPHARKIINDRAIR